MRSLLPSRPLACALALAVVGGSPSVAGANPKSLPFTYTFQTLAAGDYEIELYGDLTPVKALSTPGDTLASTSTIDDGPVLKQRLRGRFAEVGDWPVDVSLYGEVVERQREIELEAKVNLERRLGLVSLVANLSTELGVEYWTRIEFPDFSGVDAAERPRVTDVSQVHYLGPTALIQTEHVWWTTGLYWRLSDVGEPLDVGADYGKVLVRTIIGISP